MTEGQTIKEIDRQLCIAYEEDMSDVGLDDEQHSPIGHNLGIPHEQREIHPTSMNVVSLTPSMTVEETQTQPCNKRKTLKRKRIQNDTQILTPSASIDQIEFGILFKDKDTVRNSRFRGSELFKVVNFEKRHSCSINFITSDMRNATSKVIAEYITDLVRHTLQEITPKFVIEEMRSRYGLHIGYHKAWCSLQHTYNVIRGSPENNYTLLPQYLHMMKLRNPGTVANIKWTADNKFKYAFFAYGASIEGWKHCRPVMMVDATFLKSKYQGVLMIAVAKDGNNSIFPLAFGIADSENNESYRWFFRHVKKVFDTRKDLSILSDRHASIATAIKELYPDTQH
ncbi:uncharacterized protein LOC132611814 [Lycium barbarum]|uniref:uncharacterized protein LOC132611814 n=1 Tax=Lycium barbarum TaxID=112863 RepID=UPI00293E0CE2|nr:uncharacterized protein LOC132611814 [Lycium barbarum]